MRFEVLAGRHIQDGVTYNKGQVVESNRDLTQVFRNKFQKLHSSERREEETESEEKPKGKGKDSTEKFTMATEYGLEVFRRGKYYHVYEEDQNTPLNEKGLKKVEVEPFIETWLED